MLEKRNFYINGKWVEPKNSKDIQVINPATEKVVQLFHWVEKKMLMMRYQLQKLLFKHGVSQKKKRGLNY